MGVYLMLQTMKQKKIFFSSSLKAKNHYAYAQSSYAKKTSTKIIKEGF